MNNASGIKERINASPSSDLEMTHVTQTYLNTTGLNNVDQCSLCDSLETLAHGSWRTVHSDFLFSSQLEGSRVLCQDRGWYWGGTRYHGQTGCFSRSRGGSTCQTEVWPDSEVLEWNHGTRQHITVIGRDGCDPARFSGTTVSSLSGPLEGWHRVYPGSR